MSSILTDVVETGEKRDTRYRRMTPPERRRQLVQRYRASGQTMAAFARRERINEATFAGWVAKALREPGAHPTRKFAELALPFGPRPALPAAVLEVRLADGTVLRGSSGVLQSDQYGAYASHKRKTEGIVRVGCWAHARRRFHEALKERPKAANLVLRLIARLYGLERDWEEAKVGEARADLRREKFARPLRWVRQVVTGLARQALLGKACSYLLNHWEVWVAHQNHSFTRIDNNLVENAIRPSAIGKKNWLFIGHPTAGQRSALIYSLVVSCQRHGKDPLAYLSDFLASLPALTNRDDLTPLTPAAWQVS
jgi:transposase-like protein